MILAELRRFCLADDLGAEGLVDLFAEVVGRDQAFLLRLAQSLLERCNLDAELQRFFEQPDRVARLRGGVGLLAESFTGFARCRRFSLRTSSTQGSISS